MDLAKLFWNGRSQAVRLPREYRFDGSEVRIRREGRRVILEPVGNTVEDIAEAAAETIGRLREEIRQGYASGEASDWDLEQVKREARERFEADRRR